ncbi:oxidoreductase family protein [Cercophora newfieldiana]|uniref:Oxidoreductase family protein n=1 Tax=Cercophora newfieldiana TaxID=92897 RepID=A0AA39YK38_9PEZI|nr:oxidoreductase family protein [Cercophora newfieldiana]
MTPIRVGIIGLGPESQGYAPGLWAAVAHLPPLRASPSYDIVAIANSSIASAEKSIKSHNLPPTTAAYGSAADLAADPNVDLVVVSVRVQKHFELAQAAIQHGKHVFVEWPLGASLDEAEQLTKMAKDAGVKTAVGVQARASRVVLAVKKILASGKLGRILSSHVLGNMSLLPAEEWWEGFEYYMDMKSGGNSFYIYFAHFLDSFIDVLGDFETVQAALHTQRPVMPIVNLETREVVNPGHPKTSPDHIMVQGKLESGVVASISFRHAMSGVDSTIVKWIISGTEGEMEIVFPEMLVRMDSQWQTANPAAKIVVKQGRGKAEEVDLDELVGPLEPATEGLDGVSLNTGLVYDAFARGDESRYATFETALKTQRVLDRIARAAGVDV